MVSNQLQVEIDAKAARVALLRKELEKCRIVNAKLSKRLAMCTNLSTCEVLMTVSAFSSTLTDTIKSIREFTKLLIGLMKNPDWDLDSAASWVHPDVEYIKKGHMQYAFLSYVCFLMMKGFDAESFWLGESADKSCVNSSLRQLAEHISGNPVDVLGRNPSCDFSRFCEFKCQGLIRPTMETSIFGNHNKAILTSWKSLSVFYESFIHMGSSVWTLHNLAFSFNPVVDIFQAETGSEFSLICMEDVIKRSAATSRSKEKVGFTVFPGFKIGKTPIQCQVYLSGLKCKDWKCMSDYRIQMKIHCQFRSWRQIEVLFHYESWFAGYRNAGLPSQLLSIALEFLNGKFRPWSILLMILLELLAMELRNTHEAQDCVEYIKFQLGVNFSNLDQLFDEEYAYSGAETKYPCDGRIWLLWCRDYLGILRYVDIIYYSWFKFQ